MYLKHKLIGASAVLVAFAGIGTATALAQGATTSPTPKAPISASVPAKAAEPKSATDTDNVQQGDQNGPDVPGAESTNETETGTASDGPGGHADPAGNVGHQFDGHE